MRKNQTNLTVTFRDNSEIDAMLKDFIYSEAKANDVSKENIVKKAVAYYMGGIDKNSLDLLVATTWNTATKFYQDKLNLFTSKMEGI